MSTTAPCPVRLSLGAYALGALDPSEHAEVDAHLAVCPPCQDELAELAGLAAVLGRADEQHVLAAVREVPDLVPGVVERAVAQQRAQDRARRRARRRRLGWATGLVGAAAAVGWAVLGTPGLVPDEAAPRTVVVAAQDDTTGTRADVTLESAEQGTDIELVLGGVPFGERCSLVARAGDEEEVAASWQVDYRGDLTFTGRTRFTIDELDELRVTTDDGRTLLTMAVT
jgi:hypothetical protein